MHLTSVNDPHTIDRIKLYSVDAFSRVMRFVTGFPVSQEVHFAT